jgi:hypothetical protein
MTAEDQLALIQLNAPLGQPGSGRQRYAAAMHFNRSGRLSDNALEVYRVCSPDDGEDPGRLLEEWAIEESLTKMTEHDPAATIRTLIDEVDSYLRTLSGPGIAEVRAGLAKWRTGQPRPVAGQSNPVLHRWLEPALDSVAKTHPSLAAAIRAAVPHLNFCTFDGYPIEEIGTDFPNGHAACSLFGEDGAAIPAEDWDLGLFLMAPGILYRDHRHKAPELYAPLTGPHGWRFAPDRPLTLLPAHRPVWNEPFVPHLTKVGTVPFLSIYAWVRDINAGAEVVPASDWAALAQAEIGAEA